MRGDDLVPLLIPSSAPSMGFRQGVVVSWNQDTAENVIQVAGATLTDLPILNTSEALLLAPGDVVGIMTVGSSWFLVGRITIPGTPEAATAMEAVSSPIRAAVINTQQTTTSTAYTDLATVGPSVTARIRSTGKALVIVSAQMAFAETSTQETGCAVSFVASGANTLATSGERSVNIYMSVAGPPPSIGRTDQLGATFYLSGLNPGDTTFTLKYKTQVTAKTAYFSDRVLVVFPL